MKKAYTAVAMKMSTMELSKIAQPGGTFYGVDKLDGGKIVIFGGGIPLKSEVQLSVDLESAAVQEKKTIVWQSMVSLC